MPEVAAVLLAAVGGMVRHRRRSPTAWRTPPHVAEATISPKGLPPMLPPRMPGGGGEVFGRVCRPSRIPAVWMRHTWGGKGWSTGGEMPALSHQRGQSRALKARMASLVCPGPAAGRRLASGPVSAEGGSIGVCAAHLCARRNECLGPLGSRRSIPVRGEARQSWRSLHDAQDHICVEGLAWDCTGSVAWDKAEKLSMRKHGF